MFKISHVDVLNNNYVDISVQLYSGFIIICVIVTYIDFIGTGEPQSIQ